MQIHHWRWTAEAPWPPIAYVLDSDLWKSPLYATLRAKLLTQVPVPTMTTTETFVTVSAIPGDTDTSNDRYDYVLLMLI